MVAVPTFRYESYSWTVIRGETLNTVALVRVTGRSPENGCQYRETHRWATGPIVYMGARSSWSEILYNISNTTAGPGKMHDVCKRYPGVLRGSYGNVF